jgi:hypothetical protein
MRTSAGVDEMPKTNLATDSDLLTWPVELLRIVPPDEVERLSTLSWDTIKRKHSEKIVHLSERRVGMRVGHALMLASK